MIPKMTKKDSRLAKNLLKNLRTLMKAEGLETAADLAKRTKTTKRHCDYILKEERIPSLKVVEDLAQAFGMDGWELLLPKLIPDPDPKRFNSLIQKYMDSPEQTKSYIDNVVDIKNNGGE